MIKKALGIFLVLYVFISFSACVTAPEPSQEPQPDVTVQPVPENIPADPPAELPADPEPAAQDNKEGFTVTQEVFQETFTNIEALITQLNGIILAKDYLTWTSFLTREYINTYSSQEKLYEISQQPILKKYGIRLRSLEDYFHYVVVPSRSDARLDDLIFIDDTHIQAIMLINDKRSILYSLEKIDNQWKIGI